MTTAADARGPVGLADAADLARQLGRFFALADLAVTAVACVVTRDPLTTALTGGAAAIVVFGWLTWLGWLLGAIGGNLPAGGGLLPTRRRVLRAGARDLGQRSLWARPVGRDAAQTPLRSGAAGRPPGR
jgi:hypothetical protein